APASQWEQWLHNLQHPLAILLLQVMVILVMARVFGMLARAIRQPAVVGEIIAGICLGPSLLGWLWPGSAQWLFPAGSLQSLLFLGQIGLAFFMFVVGMQMDTANLKHKARHAVMISHVSIVFPFFLGVGLAYFIYSYAAPAGIGFLPFALFMGIAMSITAFPVLARIVQERKLSGTPLGTLALTCAAADDITAWCLLAAVVAIAKAGTFATSLITLGLAVAFICLMLYVVKPLLAARIKKIADAGSKQSLVAIVFMVVLLSGWLAEVIGIHALFGAFFAGVIMPSNFIIRKMITDKVEDFSMLLLLPIFFAYTGLRTQVALIAEDQLWFTFALIMLIAVGGKLGGSAITAKLMGQSWSDSLAIGALMNTRGLMELVVLNIGYELGILSPGIFALMVLMALATTFMTGPLLHLVYKPAVRQSRRSVIVDPGITGTMITDATSVH
ncbi:MAG TPA: cation:proton antiporter, partial [Chitinophagaceae bacterium]|nr:cation:proton antiporter [Chitinophagaceae bacterium]